MAITNYRDLDVWQTSMALVKDVYEVTRGFPKSELFGLTQQLQRSAVSIPSNIAEGHARSRTGDYLRFLSIARGSLAEAQTQLYLAQRLRYSEEHVVRRVVAKTDQVGRMLRRLEQSLQRKMTR